MISFLFLMIIVVSCFCMSKLVIRDSFLKSESFEENLLINMGLGLGIMSYMIFFCAILGLLYKSVFLILIFVPILLIIIKNKKICISNNFGKLSDYTFELKLMIFLIIFSSLVYIIATSKPTFDSDSLCYHLPVAKYFLNAHKMINISEFQQYASFPQFGEMLYVLALGLKDEILVQQIHLLAGFLSVFIVFVMIRKYFNLTSALLSALLFLLSSYFSTQFGTAMIDFFVLLYFTLVLYTFLKWYDTKHNKWFCLMSIFLGFCFAVKYTGVIAFIIPVGYFLIQIVHKRFFNKNNSKLILILFCVFIPVFPWLLRNYIFTNNPFSPFLNSIFNDKSLNSFLILDMKNHFIACKNIKNFMSYFTYIFELFIAEPTMFLFLLFPFYRNKNYHFKFIIYYVFTYLLVGTFIFPHITRFFVVVIPFVIAIGVVSSVDMMKRNKLIKIFIILFLVGSIGNRSYELVLSLASRDGIKYFLGKYSKHEYLEKYANFYMPYINENLNENDKILSINETRGYYYEPIFIKTSSSKFGSFVHSISDEKNLIKKFYEKQIKYMFVSRSDYFQKHQRPTLLTDAKVLNKNFELIAKHDVNYLYRLKDREVLEI
ncbi:ArnT family glycosyltransferase [bacterium]